MQVVRWIAVVLLGATTSCGPGVANVSGGATETADTGSSSNGPLLTTIGVSSNAASTGQDCPIGAEGCPCTQGGACDAGLHCDDGTCVPAAQTESGTTSVSGGSTSSGSTGGDSSSGTTGQNALEDWTKRRPVLLENELVDDFTDVQVLFTLDYDDDMQADFEDVRVTDEDGTPIPYWIEDRLFVVNADIWARVADLPGGDTTTLYVYYGNPEADEGSDPAATFLFFDDFDGDDLDEDIWVASGDYSVSGGQLTVETGVVHSAEPFVEAGGQLAEVLSLVEPESGLDHGSFTLGATTGTDIDGFPWAQARNLADPFFFVSLDGVGTVDYGNHIGGAPGHYGLTVDGGSVILNYGRGTIVDSFAMAWDDDMFIWLGSRRGTTEEIDILDPVFERVLVRQYIHPLPTATVGDEEDIP